MKYSITYDRAVPQNVAAFTSDGKDLAADNKHGNFEGILAALETGNLSDEEIVRLFDVALALTDKFEALSERVSVNGGKVFLDGDEVTDSISDLIIRFLSDGKDFDPLVRFLENVATNPDPHSKENLFRWLEGHRWSITTDGHFVAYKGVLKDGYLSKQEGTAQVDGRVITGRIPNVPGTRITMPRSEVQHDPSNGCSTGLHAANWNFARDWAQVVVQVKINPRDVVSVPTESGDHKLRVCAYEVVGEVTQEDLRDLIPLGGVKPRVLTAPKDKQAPKVKNKAKVTSSGKFPWKAGLAYRGWTRKQFDGLSYKQFLKAGHALGRKTSDLTRDKRKKTTDGLVRYCRDIDRKASKAGL